MKRKSHFRSHVARATGIGALVLAGIGCTSELPPAGQLVLYVNTDAPLPRPGQALGPLNPVPLFDTARFDVYPPGSTERCDECSRTIPIDHDSAQRGEISFGIVPSDPSMPPSVRVRLYLDAVESGEQPSTSGSLDTWIELPPLPDEGIVELTAVLLTETVGIEATLPDPHAAVTGPRDPSLVGSFPGARRIPCAEPPQPDEACVPGGAFWMGHPGRAAVLTPGMEADMRRIIVLDPFYIDRTEVTVAQFRDSRLEEPDDPIQWDGTVPLLPSNVVENMTQLCTYVPRNRCETTKDGKRPHCIELAEHGRRLELRGELPVTCISKEQAAAYCAERGRELPTEAQYEYLIGGTKSMLYPWGNTEPTCDDTIYGRAWTGLGYGSGVCRAPADPPAPLPAGSAPGDQLDFDGATVFDVTGNVSEWARDMWNRQDEPCWGPGLRENPICASPSHEDGPAPAVRGGNWSVTSDLLVAALRWRVLPGFNEDGNPKLRHLEIGFRCSRRAQLAYAR